MLEKIKKLFNKNKQFPSIPVLQPMDNWKEVPIKECGEPLVPLGAFSEYGSIFTDAIYYSERSSSPYKKDELNGSLITSFVRQGIAEKLSEASKNLPPKHSFLVWDTYRTLETQQALYEDFRDQLIEKKALTFEQATEEAQRFVSIPSTDPARPSPHNTGASVDLTIIKFTDKGWDELQALQPDLESNDFDIVYTAEMKRLQILREESVELPMGTRFDEVANATATRFYEEKAENQSLTKAETEILNNRRMLVDALKNVGMSNYSEEWWHFDFGNQFHAKRTEEPAIYGAVKMSEENIEHENMRQNQYDGSQHLLTQQTLPITNKLGITDENLNLVHKTAHATGDMRKTSHSKGCRLDAGYAI